MSQISREKFMSLAQRLIESFTHTTKRKTPSSYNCLKFANHFPSTPSLFNLDFIQLLSRSFTYQGSKVSNYMCSLQYFYPKKYSNRRPWAFLMDSVGNVRLGFSQFWTFWGAFWFSRCSPLSWNDDVRMYLNACVLNGIFIQPQTFLFCYFKHIQTWPPWAFLMDSAGM